MGHQIYLHQNHAKNVNDSVSIRVQMLLYPHGTHVQKHSAATAVQGYLNALNFK